MKHCLISLLIVVTVTTGGTALGQSADVALVNLVSGDVAYVSQSGTVGKVQPFMKVRDGDRITVADGGRVRIVFFEGARQELWAGPASFRAGKTASEPSSGKWAEVKNLPAGVPQRMARIPELIRFAQLGGMQVRSPPRHKETNLDHETTLTQSRAIYERMRQDSPADDIAPELYLYSALYEFLVYDEMKVVVAEMQRRQPKNQDVKILDAWLTSRLPR